MSYEMSGYAIANPTYKNIVILEHWITAANLSPLQLNQFFLFLTVGSDVESGNDKTK